MTNFKNKPKFGLAKKVSTSKIFLVVQITKRVFRRKRETADRKQETENSRKQFKTLHSKKKRRFQKNTKVFGTV